jgi:neutral ceramidase
MRTANLLFALGLAAASFSAPPVSAAEWKAGAAKVDITPPALPRLPMSGYPGREDGHTGIHDNLYVRAIVLDDGSAKAAIVGADLIGFSHALADRILDRLARETGIPRANILLFGTHTHGAPMPSPGGPNQDLAAYTARVEESIVEAARTAMGRLEPARIGAGAGRADVNMNRRARFWDGSWWLGYNPAGFSDKTLGLVKIARPNGEPIALLANYAVHGTSMGQENQRITGDNLGAAARFVEEHYKDKVVSVWASGAAGDQAPLYDRSPRSFDGVLNTGRLLADEAVRVAGTIRTAAPARIRAAQQTVSCPGRRLTGDRGRKTHFEFVDGPPQDIRLSTLMVGDIALAGVSGEVFAIFGERLRKASPAAHTMMLTHLNGGSGYIADDASYAQTSYEIQVTRIQPGCAEKALINGLAETIGGLR